MQWQKGQSGNPAGRPRGSRNKSTIALRNKLLERVNEIMDKAIEKAGQGNIAAMRLCIDRVLPACKDAPVECELPPLQKPADSIAATAELVAAVAAGDLTPSEAANLAKLIDAHVKAIEMHDLEERLTRLENQNSQEERR